ncbi:2Fe-2S iron-sulfur cluster-binding protein [[Clostridium] aminophilum]|uniref:2Fe-2S iron-sulfur cluster-binding protein n=1 Tax=[Clostridium] aminophilum TaxID=1526 RepID=UPI003F949D2B
MISFLINGSRCQAEEGTTILEAARARGISIPTLCYLKGVSDIGSCRMCMVEAKGFDVLLPA